MQSRRLFVRCALLGACIALLEGCSGSASPGGPNQACFRALDCRGGLVCVEGRCSADISSIVPEGASSPPDLGVSSDAGN